MKYISLLWIIVILCCSPRMAHAQAPVAPYVTGTLGISDTRTHTLRTSPVRGDRWSRLNVSSVMASVQAGIRWGSHIGVDAGIRSTVGIGYPFQAINMGVRLEAGALHARLGLGRVKGFWEVAYVPEQMADSDMASWSEWESEWVNGFDLELGAAARLGAFDIGPTVWWSQSMFEEGKQRRRYGSVGIGVAARFP
jgi:hypothetical protein